MSIFKYLEYRDFVKEQLNLRKKSGAGEVSRLAEHLNANTSLVSQVLSKSRDFSLEQSFQVARYFNLNQLETKYFMQLVYYSRAGDHELKNYHLTEIESLRLDSQQIAKRVYTDIELTDSEKSFMVSTWKPSAIFVLTGTPDGMSLEDYQRHLQIDVETLRSILDRLVSIGLVQLESGRYKTGYKRLHLPKNSDFLMRHFTNWRLKAIQQLDKPSEENVAYTSVASISAADFPEFREKMLEFISKYSMRVTESGAEQVVCFNLDFYKVK